MEILPLCCVIAKVSHHDGPGLNASFAYIRGIVTNQAYSVIYVTDFDYGVRLINTSNYVSTLVLKPFLTGIVLDSTERYLYVAAEFDTAIYRVVLATLNISVYAGSNGKVLVLTFNQYNFYHQDLVVIDILMGR